MADVLFFAFFDRAPAQIAPTASRHGLPASFDPAAFEVGRVVRSESPEAFDGLLSGPLLSFAAANPRIDADALAASQQRIHVRCQLDNTFGDDHLRGAWGLVRALFDAGALAVLDAHSHRWWAAGDLADVPVDAPFDIEREIVVIAETDASEGRGYARHTRGMCKLGHPDLVLFTDDPADPVPPALLHAVAGHLAQGATLAPGETISAGGSAWRASVYEAGVNAPELHLNNQGLVLTPTGR